MWKKLGLIYSANGENEWAQTHAYLPTPFIINNDVIRVYVSFLDNNKVGRIGYVDVDAYNPVKVLSVSDKPILEVGDRGTFDDNGVNPTSVIKYNNKVLLYYMGWQLGVRVRYYVFTGLAVSKDNGNSFERHSRAPILDRNDEELFGRSAAYILHDNNTYVTYYASWSRWILVNAKEVPTYNIRCIKSDNPFKWPGYGIICIRTRGADEYGLGRPWVIKENQLYKMWYSVRSRSKGYRIGYAESRDGFNWKRKDIKAGIDVSTSGWDSSMICYPAIIDAHGKRYMFYNGNNYGETGFGVAVYDRDY